MITSYTNQINFLYKQYFPFSYKTKKKVLGADIFVLLFENRIRRLATQGKGHRVRAIEPVID